MGTIPIKRKVHILYEYDINLMPHNSAYIRLLYPLKHPDLNGFLDVSYSRDYDGQKVDAVIMDRLWHSNVSLALVERVLFAIRQSGAKLIYALDDNFLDLPAEGWGWPTEQHLQVIRFLLRRADCVWVSTQALCDLYTEFNENIIVIPNALDESLVCLNAVGRAQKHLRKVLQNALGKFFPSYPKLTIGYMGTLTHDRDLMLVLPALRQAYERNPGIFELQILGGAGQSETVEKLRDPFIRRLPLAPRKTHYPVFIKWFVRHINWNIAIAPLVDNAFTQCKSDIKFLDYSAIGVAGIYSRVPAYMSSVRHLETGWLVDNTVEAWADALEQLIRNPQLRENIGQNASQYLFSERVLLHCAHLWLDALDYTLAI